MSAAQQDDQLIDFVVLWVDGGDPAWLAEKNQYSPVKKDYSNSDHRFRDWGIFRYWFRAVEKFAPWVHKIYFVTWGHLPEWLDTSNEKLVVVNHRDFIPEQYLPTFNSNTIELNLHRIESLSEHFVLFNDDVILLRSVTPDQFFKNGLPRDMFICDPNTPHGDKYRIVHTIANNVGIINQHFKKRQVIKKHPFQSFTPVYGLRGLLKNFLFLAFENPHLCASHLKSTFKRVWSLEEEQLDATCMNKFRGFNDLNHWLMRYWNMCEGNFAPRSPKFGKYFDLAKAGNEACSYIRGQKGFCVCTNDGSADCERDNLMEMLNDAFASVLPEPCSFEKN